MRASRLAAGLVVLAGLLFPGPPVLAEDPVAPAPRPSPVPAEAAASPIDLTTPIDGGAVIPIPIPVATRAPRGTFTVTVQRFQNDAKFATSAELFRYLGGAPESRLRTFVSASYGRADYTTAVAVPVPPEPPPKKKPKKPPAPKPPKYTYVPFAGTDRQFAGAFGVELRASQTLRFRAQVGPGSRPDDDGRLHAGILTNASAEWYRAWDTGRPGTPYSSADASINAEGGVLATTALFLEVQRGIPIGRSVRSPELTARATVFADSHRRFFNNVAEAAVGVRIAPLGNAGPALALEAVAGQYGVFAPMPSGARRGYGALRPSISESIRF